MITAIFPGTFDPITHGHSDLAARATHLFERVIIAVAENPGKKPLLSLEKRIALTIQATQHLPHVTVKGFSGLLVDFAVQHQATAIIRGLRASADLDHELQLAYMNQQLNAKIETIFLTPSVNYAFLSSSLLREVAMLGGDISGFVHPAVLNELTALWR